MTYFFRADLSHYAEAEYPLTEKINSAGELLDYYKRNREIYQFGQGYYGEESMADVVFSDSSGFNDDFFETRFLLFVVLEEGSGSVRHRVESVKPDGGFLSINITRIIPGICTADMAQWHIAFDLDKALSDRDAVISLSEERLPVE